MEMNSMVWHTISHCRILEKSSGGWTRYPIIVSVGLLILSSCLDESDKTYIVTDTYRVLAGPQAGFSGSSQYEVTISLADKRRAEYVARNFADAYSVKVLFSNNNFTIPKQDFPYHQGRVTIYGQGVIRGDTLIYDYFSGGPAGQINCNCVAVLKK
jgi:hypothetical protein